MHNMVKSINKEEIYIDAFDRTLKNNRGLVWMGSQMLSGMLHWGDLIKHNNALPDRYQLSYRKFSCPQSCDSQSHRAGLQAGRERKLDITLDT